MQKRYEAQSLLVGRPPGRLLDLGAARGDFVDWMLSVGWDASGIEPFARPGATHPHVRNTSIDDPSLPDGSFDVITAWHVLEHVHAPARVFQRINRLLKPGGRLCMSVPNFDSFHSLWLRGEDVPRHLYFYTRQSLDAYAALAGMTVTQRIYSGNFANGAAGRGALARYVYQFGARVSAYDYNRSTAVAAGRLADEHPLLAQIARPVNWLERRLLSPQRLAASGKMGVIAVVMVKTGAVGKSMRRMNRIDRVISQISHPRGYRLGAVNKIGAVRQHRLWRDRPMPDYSRLLQRRTPIRLAPQDSAWARLVRTIGRENRQRILDAAAHVLGGESSILGLGWVPTGFPPAREIDLSRSSGDQQVGVDRRINWEIDRCNEAVWLAQAYDLTEDEDYAQGAVSLIDGWIGAFSQTPTLGVRGWPCAMEAGLRVMNWLVAAELIARSGAIDPEFWGRLAASVALHGAFIRRNLEIELPRSGNHLLADLAALVYVSMALPQAEEAPEWRRCGLRGLVREAKDQFEADGSHHEAAPAYHALACELLGWSFLLARAHGWEMPRSLRANLRSAFSFDRQIRDDGGALPTVADSDGSQIHPLSGPGLPPQYHADRNGIAQIEKELLGEPTEPAALKSPSLSDQAPAVKHFRHAGLVIARAGGLRLVCSLGTPRPAPRFCHQHNDLLSFTLSRESEPLIIDPGTYLYGGDRRAEFRGTLAHSTLSIDDREQHELDEDPFVLHGYRGDEVRCAEVKPREIEIAAIHRSFARLSGAPIHSRKWILSERSLVVEDEIDGAGEHRLQWSFPLAPGAVDLDATSANINLRDGSTWRLSWQAPPLSARIVSQPWSAMYGHIDTTVCIRATLVVRLPVALRWSFELK